MDFGGFLPWYQCGCCFPETEHHHAISPRNQIKFQCTKWCLNTLNFFCFAGLFFFLGKKYTTLELLSFTFSYFESNNYSPPLVGTFVWNITIDKKKLNVLFYYVGVEIIGKRRCPLRKHQE